MKREIALHFDLALVCAVALLGASCAKEGGAASDGCIRVRVNEQSASATKASDKNMPDTNDFILEIVSSDGTVVYKGPYGQSPETVSAPSGSCNVSIRSNDFSAPQFSSPQYGDDQCVVVPSGGTVDVELMCTQLNCGIGLDIAPEFLTSCPDGVIFVKGEGGRLMYSYSEKRIAYFLPGNVSVVMSDSAGEKVLLTRALAAREIFRVKIGVAAGASSTSGGGITVQVDTSRIWTDEDYVIGGESAKGDREDNALTVVQARSAVGQKDVWVSGYIVGGDLTTSDTGISFTAPFKSATNLAIASRGSVSTKASCLSVQLPSGDVRDALNLVSNPQLIGRRVCLLGDVTASYFGLVGIKNVSDYVLY